MGVAKILLNSGHTRSPRSLNERPREAAVPWLDQYPPKPFVSSWCQARSRRLEPYLRLPPTAHCWAASSKSLRRSETAWPVSEAVRARMTALCGRASSKTKPHHRDRTQTTVPKQSSSPQLRTASAPTTTADETSSIAPVSDTLRRTEGTSPLNVFNFAGRATRARAALLLPVTECSSAGGANAVISLWAIGEDYPKLFKSSLSTPTRARHACFNFPPSSPARWFG